MSNGHKEDPSTRRMRFDDLASTVVRAPAASPTTGGVHSGRVLVLAACATILVLWGTLYLGFREWRSRYRARADFGATQVAPVIDPLADVAPPGIEPRTWKEAVRETHSMLVSVTGSNLLDVPQMEALRGELQQVVARATVHPDQAPRELASVWDTMTDRAEFVLREGTSGRKKGHPRPAILPRPAAPDPKSAAPRPNRSQDASSSSTESAPAS